MFGHSAKHLIDTLLGDFTTKVYHFDNVSDDYKDRFQEVFKSTAKNNRNRVKSALKVHPRMGYSHSMEQEMRGAMALLTTPLTSQGKSNPDEIAGRWGKVLGTLYGICEMLLKLDHQREDELIKHFAVIVEANLIRTIEDNVGKVDRDLNKKDIYTTLFSLAGLAHSKECETILDFAKAFH